MCTSLAGDIPQIADAHTEWMIIQEKKDALNRLALMQKKTFLCLSSRWQIAIYHISHGILSDVVLTGMKISSLF